LRGEIAVGSADVPAVLAEQSAALVAEQFVAQPTILVIEHAMG
jgi:hypothetical protein